MIYCAACQRRMQGQYNHGAAYYRCRFPHEYALANEVEHPRNVYLREDALTDPLDAWLASAFTPDHLEQTITAMANAQPVDELTPLTATAQPPSRPVTQSSRSTGPPSTPAQIPQ